MRPCRMTRKTTAQIPSRPWNLERSTGLTPGDDGSCGGADITGLSHDTSRQYDTNEPNGPGHEYHTSPPAFRGGSWYNLALAAHRSFTHPAMLKTVYDKFRPFVWGERHHLPNDISTAHRPTSASVSAGITVVYLQTKEHSTLTVASTDDELIPR